jgi:hypothetical protein
VIALLIVRRSDPLGEGTFVAERLTREGNTWTAAGSWKHDSGRLSEPGTYTWPTSRVHEIRWAEATA